MPATEYRALTPAIQGAPVEFLSLSGPTLEQAIAIPSGSARPGSFSWCPETSPRTAMSMAGRSPSRKVLFLPRGAGAALGHDLVLSAQRPGARDRERPADMGHLREQPRLACACFAEHRCATIEFDFLPAQATCSIGLGGIGGLVSWFPTEAVSGRQRGSPWRAAMPTNRGKAG